MSSQSKSKSNSNKNEELPKGWIVRHSFTRKKDYYFNVTTKVTSWNKPDGLSSRDNTSLPNAQGVGGQSKNVKRSQASTQNAPALQISHRVKPQKKSSDCAPSGINISDVKVKFNVKQRVSLKRPAEIFETSTSNNKSEKGHGVLFVSPKKRKTEKRTPPSFENIQSSDILQTEKNNKLCHSIGKSCNKTSPRNALPDVCKLPQRCKSLQKNKVNSIVSESKINNIDNVSSSKVKSKSNLRVHHERSRTFTYPEAVSTRGSLSQSQLIRRYDKMHSCSLRNLENKDTDHLTANAKIQNSLTKLKKPYNEHKSVVESTIWKAENLSAASSKNAECLSPCSRSTGRNSNVAISNFKFTLKDCGLEDIDMEWEAIENEQVLLNIQEHRQQSIGSSYLEPPEDMEVNYYDLSSSGNKNCIIVLDTNILISCMIFVKELSEKEHKGIGRPILIIPWMVLKELDAMKGNRSNTKSSSPKLKSNARIAIHFINHCFNSHHPFVKGQSAMDDKEELIKVEVPDDSILNCCLQLSKKGNTTILLSNDVNLCNKAMANGILSYGKEKLEKEVQSEKLGLTAVSLKNAVNEVVHQQVKRLEGIPQQKILEKQCENYKVHHPHSELKTLLNDFLSNLLKTEMKRVFEDMWIKVVYIKPPWTLLDTLKCIDKHWLAVFSFIICKSARNIIEELLNFFKNPPSDPTSDEIETIVGYGLTICRAVTLKEYKGLISEYQQKFEDILNNLHENQPNVIPEVVDCPILSSATKSVKFTDETCKDAVFEAFQIALSLVNNFCGTVCDTIGVDHGITYQKPDTFPTVNEINQRLPHVSEYVAKLTSSMFSVLETPVSCLSAHHPAIVNLHTSLLTVISSDCQISHTIQCERLLSFALEGHTRLMLSNGVKQFTDFQMILSRLVSYLMKTK